MPESGPRDGEVALQVPDEPLVAGQVDGHGGQRQAERGVECRPVREKAQRHQYDSYAR